MSTKPGILLVAVTAVIAICLGPALGISRPLLSTNLSSELTTRYLSNAELAAWMTEFTGRCGHMSRKFSVGASVKGQRLWVLEISNNPGAVEPKPNFKYIANMHGDETSGRMLLPKMAEWLCENLDIDERANKIVEGIHLYLLPTMNPDGYDRQTRSNAADIDLNRNFPDAQMICEPSASNCTNVLQMLKIDTSVQQPETAAVMRWSMPVNARRRRSVASPAATAAPEAAQAAAGTSQQGLRRLQFHASANMHEGALVANYPFDGQDRWTSSSSQTVKNVPELPEREQGPRAAGVVSAAAAAAASQQLAALLSSQSASKPTTPLTTAEAEAEAAAAAAEAAGAVRVAGINFPSNDAPDKDTFIYLAKTYANAHATMKDSTEFPGGIVNGASWYDVYGGMQDWNYVAVGCMELTLELSQEKSPDASKLEGLWNDNRDALLALPITAVLGGVHGTVVADDTGLPLPAAITVMGISWKTIAEPMFGYYNRPLVPGSYKIRAAYTGHRNSILQVTVPEDGSGVTVNFRLKPANKRIRSL